MFTSWVTILALAAVSSSSATTPPVIGSATGHLDHNAIQSIARLVDARDPAWLIRAERSLVRDDPPRVLVYLSPTQATETLRRGIAMRLRGPRTGDHADDWLVDSFGTWAQVAEGDEFRSAAGRAPEWLERPFELEGEIADSELLDLVQFIRSGPAEKGPPPVVLPGGQLRVTGSAPVDGGNAITSVDVRGDGEYVISTEDQLVGGQVFSVSRHPDGWRVTRLVYVLQ